MSCRFKRTSKLQQTSLHCTALNFICKNLREVQSSAVQSNKKWADVRPGKIGPYVLLNLQNKIFQEQLNEVS